MIKADRVIPWPEVPCQCPKSDGCVCTDSERALRGWSNGAALPPMTPEQVAWCRDAVREAEGVLPEGRAQNLDDLERGGSRWLARAVLFAWIGAIRRTLGDWPPMTATRATTEQDKDRQ